MESVQTSKPRVVRILSEGVSVSRKDFMLEGGSLCMDLVNISYEMRSTLQLYPEPSKEQTSEFSLLVLKYLRTQSRDQNLGLRKATLLRLGTWTALSEREVRTTAIIILT